MRKIAWRESLSIRYAIMSQLVFLATLLVCVAIQPRLLAQNNPISMFGNVHQTAVPFVAGFLLTATILFCAARAMSAQTFDERRLRNIFVALAIVMVALPITPFTVNSVFYYTHVAFAAIFYTTALWSGAWFLQKQRGHSILDMLLYVAIITGIIGAIFSTSEVGTLHLLAVSQLPTVTSYSILFIRSIAHLEIVKRSSKGDILEVDTNYAKTQNKNY